jgi:membrane protease YdiL (CAAX protease family)
MAERGESAAAGRDWPAPLGLLFAPTRPLWQFTLLAVPVALVPSLLLSLLAWTVAGAAGLDPARHAPPEFVPSGRVLFAVVVFAPLAETLLLGALIALLGRLGLRPLPVAVLSALAWGLLHATAGAMWFFGTVWSFFVFSAAWIGWRRRSRRHAFAAAALPHALMNLLVMAMVAVGSAQPAGGTLQ